MAMTEASVVPSLELEYSFDEYRHEGESWSSWHALPEKLRSGSSESP
jgi:hypothetical protein